MQGIQISLQNLSQFILKKSKKTLNWGFIKLVESAGSQLNELEIIRVEDCTQAVSDLASSITLIESELENNIELNKFSESQKSKIIKTTKKYLSSLPYLTLKGVYTSNSSEELPSSEDIEASVLLKEKTKKRSLDSQRNLDYLDKLDRSYFNADLDHLFTKKKHKGPIFQTQNNFYMAPMQKSKSKRKIKLTSSTGFFGMGRPSLKKFKSRRTLRRPLKSRGSRKGSMVDQFNKLTSSGIHSRPQIPYTRQKTKKKKVNNLCSLSNL